MVIIMMRPLGSMMVIKTQGPESTNKRRVNAYCLASIKVVGK